MDKVQALVWALGTVTLMQLAHAAGPQPGAAPARDEVKVAQAGDSRCRKEIKDYVDTLRYVRQTAGTQIGDKVAGGFISEPELDKVIASQGHCAAAQLLRERGTPR